MAAPDRRIAKTRKAIDTAFYSLMQEVDFRDITVNDVAARAEISRTTFYHHYADKFDWLEQTIRNYLRSYTEKYRGSDPLHRATVLHNLTELFGTISANSQLCKLILVNENSQLLYDIFRESLLEEYHIQSGPAAVPTTEEDLTIHYLCASTSAFIEWWVRNDTLFTPEQMAQCIYSFHHVKET